MILSFITVSQLPEALAKRGFTITPRQARSIAAERKLPFFKSPIGRELVITEELLDQALTQAADQAQAEWRRAARPAALPSRRKISRLTRPNTP
jgi:hypothetical protein